MFFLHFHYKAPNKQEYSLALWKIFLGLSIFMCGRVGNGLCKEKVGWFRRSDVTNVLESYKDKMRQTSFLLANLGRFFDEKNVFFIDIWAPGTYLDRSGLKNDAER